MNKSTLKNTFAGIGATVAAVSIGYFRLVRKLQRQTVQSFESKL
jgi:hypothetical protein